MHTDNGPVGEVKLYKMRGGSNCGFYVVDKVEPRDGIVINCH